MSVHTRHQRHDSSRLGHLSRYWWYAIGEVILIFAGITLALWFSNWNEARREQVVEYRTLTDILANLRANEAHIKENIAFDQNSIQACNVILAAIEARDAWVDSYEFKLNTCRWWSSPYLSAAAYDSLKLRGTDLISDRVLRDDIVKLYELNYAFLVNDFDKSFWQFQEAVLFPVFNQYVREIGDENGRDRMVPNDWTAVLDSHEFSNSVLSKRTTQQSSITAQVKALERTQQVSARIEAWLNLHSALASD